MSEPKLGPSDFQRQVERLKAAGQMPSLERLLDAIAEATAEYSEKILATRQQRKRDIRNL
jgi:hypothetical protein